jgi:hypothetical protein
MPRYTVEKERKRAERLVKPLIANGLNESALARQLGVTPQAINQRVNRKPVQDILQKFLNSPRLKNRLIKVAEEGLKADKVISCNVIAPNGEGMKDANSMTKDFVDVPDHQARHKFWHDLMVGAGAINNSENGKGGNVSVIIGITNQSGLLSAAETEHISQERSKV